MAVTRPGGSVGGAGGKSNATTRLDVVDPHILIMMRDVMDSAETAVRLNPVQVLVVEVVVEPLLKSLVRLIIMLVLVEHQVQ